MTREEAEEYAKKMTYRDAINNLMKARSIPYRKATFIKVNELLKTLEQEPKWDRLYSWLNDMRLGIAPDETVTDIDERNVRTAQVDLLDEIMEWMVEPQKGANE